MQKSLPSRYYTTPEFLAREQSQIFAREWFCAGREEDLSAPGNHAVLDVANESILVVRTANRPTQSPLQRLPPPRRPTLRTRPKTHVNRRSLERHTPRRHHLHSSIRCPYHQWTYNLDGELLGAPFLKDSADLPQRRLLPLPSRHRHLGRLLLPEIGKLDPENNVRESRDAAIPTRPRHPAHPALPARRISAPRHTITYDVAANWKLILENYNECYHCGGVHPELCEVVPDFKQAGGSNLNWDDGIPHRPGAYTFTKSGTTTRAPFPGLNEAEKTRHKGELCFPNLMLSLACDHVAAFILWPLAPDRTRIVCRFLFHPRRNRKERFQSRRRRGILGPGQPPGLGHLRARPTRRLLPHPQIRLLRPHGRPQPRHPQLHPVPPRPHPRVIPAAPIRDCLGSRTLRSLRERFRFNFKHAPPTLSSRPKQPVFSALGSSAGCDGGPWHLAATTLGEINDDRNRSSPLTLHPATTSASASPNKTTTQPTPTNTPVNPTIFPTAKILFVSVGAWNHRNPNRHQGRRKSHASHKPRHPLPSRHAKSSRRRRLRLHLEHRRKHIQIRQKRPDNAGAHQHVVRPLHARPRLPQKNNPRRHHRLRKQRHMRRPPLRMQFPKRSRQKSIDPRHKRHPAHRRQKSARRSHIADRNQRRRHRNQPKPSQPHRRLRHRLHDPLQIVHFAARQRQQHRHGPADIAKRHNRLPPAAAPAAASSAAP